MVYLIKMVFRQHGLSHQDGLSSKRSLTQAASLVNMVCLIKVVSYQSGLSHQGGLSSAWSLSSTWSLVKAVFGQKQPLSSTWSLASWWSVFQQRSHCYANSSRRARGVMIGSRNRSKLSCMFVFSHTEILSWPRLLPPPSLPYRPPAPSPHPKSETLVVGSSQTPSTGLRHSASCFGACLGARLLLQSIISTRNFRRALTASVDSCAEIKSAPSVA